MTNVTHLCPRCAVPCGSRCDCGEIAIPRQPMPGDFTEGPPQTDLTMLSYHEVDPYRIPTDEKCEETDEYD